jgi:hypothetical protein
MPAGSKRRAPGSASARAWASPPSLKTMASWKSPANALPPAFNVGIPNILLGVTPLATASSSASAA